MGAFIVLKEYEKKPVACKQCGKMFTRRTKTNIYCSKKCRNVANAPIFDGPTEIGTTGTIGAIHELRVAIDLMSKGWWVFRAMSPNGPVDLVAIRGKDVIRVQVTKAQRSKKTGTLWHGKKSDKAKENYDMLALSFPTGVVIYEPPLKE